MEQSQATNPLKLAFISNFPVCWTSNSRLFRSLCCVCGIKYKQTNQDSLDYKNQTAWFCYIALLCCQNEKNKNKHSIGWLWHQQYNAQLTSTSKNTLESTYPKIYHFYSQICLVYEYMRTNFKYEHNKQLQKWKQIEDTSRIHGRVKMWYLVFHLEKYIRVEPSTEKKAAISLTRN